MRTIEKHCANSHSRTLGLFGFAKCLLLDVDPFHAGILQHQWDLSSLKCHGGEVFFEDNKLHVSGNGSHDVSYRGVKFSSRRNHTKGISYSNERLFTDSVMPLEKGMFV